MKTTFLILSALVAIEHIYFLVLEMFYWTKPKGMKAFGQSKEAAEKDLANRNGEFDYSAAAVQLAEASAQLRTLQAIRKKMGK